MMTKKVMENRLHRLEGQITSLRVGISKGLPCEAMVMQFLAVKGAFNAAFLLYVKESLADCQRSDAKERDQLISLLIRK